jgi:hypothetical protein
MYSIEVPYTSYDNEEKTETVWFDLDADVILENLDIADELQDVVAVLEKLGDNIPSEGQRKMVMAAIKKMMKISFGVRDGDTFDQSPEAWEHFAKTAVYKKLLRMFWLEPETYFVPFATGIINKQLMDAVAAAQAAEGEEKKYTREELLNMPQSEFDEVVGTDPLRMSQEHLQIAFQRKGQTRGGSERPSEG